MEPRTTPSPPLEQQEMSLFLFVVFVGYIITFSASINGGAIARLLIGIGCDIIYLVPGFFEAEILRRFSHGVRNAVYFSRPITPVFFYRENAIAIFPRSIKPTKGKAGIQL